MCGAWNTPRSLSFHIVLPETNRNYLSISPLSIIYQNFDVLRDQGCVVLPLPLIVLPSSQVPGAPG